MAKLGGGHGDLVAANGAVEDVNAVLGAGNRIVGDVLVAAKSRSLMASLNIEDLGGVAERAVSGVDADLLLAGHAACLISRVGVLPAVGQSGDDFFLGDNHGVGRDRNDGLGAILLGLDLAAVLAIEHAQAGGSAGGLGDGLEDLVLMLEHLGVLGHVLAAGFAVVHLFTDGIAGRLLVDDVSCSNVLGLVSSLLEVLGLGAAFILALDGLIVLVALLHVVLVFGRDLLAVALGLLPVANDILALDELVGRLNGQGLLVGIAADGAHIELVGLLGAIGARLILGLILVSHDGERDLDVGAAAFLEATDADHAIGLILAHGGTIGDLDLAVGAFGGLVGIIGLGAFLDGVLNLDRFGLDLLGLLISLEGHVGVLRAVL